MTNVLFGVMLIVALAAAGWYVGQASMTPWQKAASLVVAVIGTLVVAALLSSYFFEH